MTARKSELDNSVLRFSVFPMVEMAASGLGHCRNTGNQLKSNAGLKLDCRGRQMVRNDVTYATRASFAAVDSPTQMARRCSTGDDR